ncbi:uncharacterized serine-rich protein C215.13-like [Impatiens glandulifera]|uniref:uncharacterized serine-rich protein C215.13-like n=1 Tax=Impatiens glandulifera TaxID=253017 RepID=UPI001FB13EF7|nr:uncharacterized serine-rich protein C215.13-like [Impatiens glandulifera]
MDYDDSNMEVVDSEMSSASSSSVSSLTDLEDEDEEEVASSLNNPLQNMSSLLHQLPFKKGLSKHYQGKSQSFISMAKVSCLEDLIKQENPYNKKLKSSRSYGGFLSEAHMLINPSSSTSSSENNTSRDSCSSSLSTSKRNQITQKSITSSASTNNLSSSTSSTRTTFLI